MNVFDSHIHFDELHGAFDTRAPAAATRYGALVPGIELARTVARLAQNPPAELHFGVGQHPWYLRGEPDAEFTRALARAANAERVCAIGETGLDHRRHRTPAERTQALRWFAAHIETAHDLGLPLVVHCVRAHGECLTALRAVRPRAGGVVHAFSAGAPTMREYAELGFSIGIGAAVTRDRSRRVRAAAVEVPAEQLLVETDAPYMAVGDGTAGEGRPDDVMRVVEVIARLRGETPSAIADLTWENARRLFGLSGI